MDFILFLLVAKWFISHETLFMRACQLVFGPIGTLLKWDVLESPDQHFALLSPALLQGSRGGREG